MEFKHTSVLLQESIEMLQIKPDGIYLDATAGGAGHSSEIAKRLTTGRLIAFDKDPDAVAVATQRLAPYPQAQVVQCDFAEMDQQLKQLGIPGLDGIFMDLGVSSYQLDNAARGFSFHNDAPLDMRMAQTGLSARDVVNRYSEEELTRIFFTYGEEKFSRRIAAQIVQQRQQQEIVSTLQLAELIKQAIPAAARRQGGHPAKRVFQAIRIEVNQELTHLQQAMETGFAWLNPGGVMAIITFHSLEDRMVKQQFASWCTGCTCPPDFPVCVCGKKPLGKLINRKPIEAGQQELQQNHRSHSAKLRGIMKLQQTGGTVL